MTATRPRVVLTGPPGSGKTTVGRILAERLGVAFRDTDADVERTAGKAVADIFVDDGEPRFRELEREAVTTALATHDGVLALGGGAVMDAHTQSALTGYAADGGTVVFLDVSLAQAAPRVGFNRSRPLLVGNPRGRWAELMQARRPTYERLATTVVVSDERTAAQVADEILQEVRS
ncbi:MULTISPECIES: shikimate kinase [unclassified Isoptericola]|uniref:shikimate kinase n=1 Tax=unclassified Isoptericola TaxID=2623355 RepID=UPI0027141093|nr:MULTISPECIES: shikimate kinase [unclassified Isoptericola]MDO8145042.1 shikimate kinase [Isoptericola sp. 178]MDO8148676.1 shikimate kinase [Isoptericola sp. b515]MDO8151378.1 shikimate kinase [Isoptericola sp. b408]